MNTSSITIGRRVLPIEQIALIEPFDSSAPSKLQSDRAFQARVVLLDRDSVLSEQTVEVLANNLRFRLLPDDRVATNPKVRMAVEMFEPAEGFQPGKPYRSRIKWTDEDGNSQSKLLLSDPSVVLAIAVRGEEPSATNEPAEGVPAKPPRRSRRRSRSPVTDPEIA